MSDQRNQNWKLGFGLLAGALAGFWLNSDRGRRVRSDFQQSAVEYDWTSKTSSALTRPPSNRSKIGIRSWNPSGIMLNSLPIAWS